jgi:hypothetical protein
MFVRMYGVQLVFIVECDFVYKDLEYSLPFKT